MVQLSPQVQVGFIQEKPMVQAKQFRGVEVMQSSIQQVASRERVPFIQV